MSVHENPKKQGGHPRNKHKRGGFDGGNPHKPQKRHSLWGDVWHRLKSYKLAMAGMILAIILILASILAPVLTPYAFDKQDMSARFAPISAAHPFGTDNLGRDLLTRILYGGRTSLLVALLAIIISTAVALLLGSAAGYFGGWVETTIMRVMDVLMSIPSILLAMSISAALGSGIIQTAIAISVHGITQNTRLLRAQVLTAKGQEYVEAAVANGSRSFRVMFRQILPNCLAPMIVSVSLAIGMNIVTISSLSFIGLGVQPPIAEWGNIMVSGLQYMRQYWQLATFPGLMIFLSLFAFNTFGDGLRDAMDPKLKY